MYIFDNCIAWRENVNVHCWSPEKKAQGRIKIVERGGYTTLRIKAGGCQPYAEQDEEYTVDSAQAGGHLFRAAQPSTDG
jgi:hypothetical protein